ncbi:MAG: hypothetical protein EOP62_09135 [Sphingomonadales bacterium]|nr:MAG: hypothetical protein EOP62_09135 [Sphingomonadales bacterium]
MNPWVQRTDTSLFWKAKTMRNPNGRQKGALMMWILGFAGLATLAAVVLVALGARKPEFAVEHGNLTISNSLFGRTIPAAELDIASARIIDFQSSPQLAPHWRKFGIGLPGRQSGWYSIRNGRSALLFLTRSDRVIYLDSRNGYSILLSPENPEAFLSKMQSGK